MSKREETYFKQWMRQVDEYVFDKLDLHLDDLPDEMYRIEFDEGCSPLDMGKHVVSEYMKMYNELIGKK